MATLMYTSLCMMIIVTNIYGSPIKRSATDQQATDCYGTECYYDPDYFESDTTVNVNFPENLTQVVLKVLPLIPELMEKHEQQIQNLTTVVAELPQTQMSETLTQIANTQTQMSSTLTQMADTQTQMSSTLTQMASTQSQLANSFNQVVHLLEKQDQQQQNMTSAMNSVVSVLQNQQEILEDINHSVPLVLDQQENQIELLNLSLSASDMPCGQQLQNSTAMLNNEVFIFGKPSPSPEVLSTPSTPSPAQQPPPKDCQDVAAAGSSYKSGVYTITPQDDLGSFQVYCDFETDGGGWTVFQKRFDGSLDFFLRWEQYEEGFGNPHGEYWMGLRDIHRLTRNHAWVLRIDMEAFDGDTAYAMYDSFSVGDASSNYRLHIDAYHGTAGDSLAVHNGHAFSTKDRDNDADGGNCAQYFKGAWWYDDCHDSNLNALYLGATGNSNTGNVWFHWKGTKSLKRTEMKMRRVG